MNLDTILTSLSIGLLATLTPCVLPLFPGYLAYLSGGREGLASSRGRYFLGFFVLAGVLAMMLALGLVIALLSISVGRVLAFLLPFADAAIIALGILLLLNRNPFAVLPQIQVPALRNPFVNAFMYGLLYGPIALPCSGPLVVSIFAYSFTMQEALAKLNVFLWFGIGFGLPLLALSLLSGAAQRWIIRLSTKYGREVNMAGGALLLAIGIYDLWVNWDLIRLFLNHS